MAIALAGALLSGSWSASPAAVQRDEGEPRLVAVGDIHGAHTQLTALLQQLGLVDRTGRWSGGRTTLVQTGDFTDRGAAVRPVMDLLMAVERQAEAAGGRLVGLIGNHEAMNVLRLHQDVSPQAYATFADARSEARRTEAFSRYVRFNADRRRELGREPPDVLDRDAWMRAHPPGFLEYVEAFGPRGQYGRWIRGKNAAVKVGETLFVHGGLNPEVAERSVDAINRRVRNEIARFDRVSQQLIDRDVILPFYTFDETIAAARAELDVLIARMQGTAGAAGPVLAEDQQFALEIVDLLKAGSWSLLDPNGPLWFRGFANWTPEEGTPQVAELLARYDVRRMVVGHTYSEDFRIRSRFDGRVFLIDTGMLTEVYKGGRPSALELTGNQATAIYLGGERTAPASTSQSPEPATRPNNQSSIANPQSQTQ